MQSLKDLWFGITKHKAKTITYIFTCFSVLFTFVKIVTQFFPSVQISGVGPLVVGIVISIGWGLWKVWKPSKTSIRVAHSSTTVEIVFGDIFVQDGIRAIGVSEFFETELGTPVSDKSLHGAFLKRHFSGYAESIDNQLAADLKKEEPTDSRGQDLWKKALLPHRNHRPDSCQRGTIYSLCPVQDQSRKLQSLFRCRIDVACSPSLVATSPHRM